MLMQSVLSLVSLHEIGRWQYIRRSRCEKKSENGEGASKKGEPREETKEVRLKINEKFFIKKL